MVMTPISLENRAVLALDGPDAVAFLQGLITHDVALVAPGRAVFAGLLSPQGKALFDFHLHAGDGGAILIDVAAEKADALLKRLSMYKLRKAVTLVRGLPLDAEALSALGKRLRTACGSGGTVKDGVVELQGDHCERVIVSLKAEGWQVKRAGG